jgi:hypothetical protein
MRQPFLRAALEEVEAAGGPYSYVQYKTSSKGQVAPLRAYLAIGC